MKYRFFYIYAAVLIVFNIFLLNFPLTNILGYEFSVINSILITLLSGLFVIRLLKLTLYQEHIELNSFLRILFEGNLVFISVPLLMGFTAALFIKNCSLAAGLGYYSVITLPAIVIGTSLGLLSYYISVRVPKLILLLLFIIILLLPLYELYFYPQIYFYNPILAYLPGTIYDEAVRIDWKLISYRLLNILFFFSLLFYLIRYFFNLQYFHINKRQFLIAAFSVSFLFFVFSDYFGFATTLSRMKSDLKRHITTEHFEIYLDESISKKNVESIVFHHEYYFEEISNYLKVYPRKRTTSFIFKNSAQKKDLLGTANADMAKPWLNTVFVNSENFEQTLKHEIVHSLSAEFGATIFKLGGFLNPSLTEGIASAVDDEYDGNPIHFMASLAYRSGYKVNIKNLFSGLSFFGQVSGLSYIFAGSFSKFLMDSYGIVKYKKVYSGEDFRKVYNKDISELAGEYYGFINKYGGNTTKAMADYYFGRLTIFRKLCARFAAEQLIEGWKKYNNGKFEEARKLFEKLFEETDSYSAFSGYVNSLIMSSNDKLAFNLILHNQHKYINTAYYFNSGIMLADIAVKLDKFSFADSVYKSVIEQKPSRNLVYLCLLRQELIKEPARIKEYIAASDTVKFRILEGMNSGNLNYITIPVLINLSEEFNRQETYLLNLSNNFEVSDSISCYSAHELSKYAVRNNEFEAARKLAEKALEYTGPLLNREILKSDLKKINWLERNSRSLIRNINPAFNNSERNI